MPEIPLSNEQELHEKHYENVDAFLSGEFGIEKTEIHLLP